MSCSHSHTCPLFPLLSGSLGGWRAEYCDTASGWQQCARYQLAARGRVVPISLLPNGRTPLAMQRFAERAATADFPSLLAPSHPQPRMVIAAADPEPAPYPSHARPPSRPPRRRTVHVFPHRMKRYMTMTMTIAWLRVPA